MPRDLIEIADQLRAIATTGLHFAATEWDRERYEKLLELAATLAVRATGSSSPEAPSVRGLVDLFREVDSGYVTPKVDVSSEIKSAKAA